MRDPENRPVSGGPPVEGGKVRLRLELLQLQRGVTDATVTQVAAAYAQGIAQAATLAQASPGPSRATGAAGAPAGPPPGPPGPPQWRFLGPEMMPNGQTYGSARVPVSGRVSSIAVDPGSRGHVLCGAAGGGVWESTSAGAAWLPRTDCMPTLTIGAIAFDPSAPQTVYAGTGEGNFYSWLGQGVLRSSDGGTTWSVLAANPFVGAGFFRIIVDAANGQHLLAATTFGVYESTDGGSTWAQVHAGTAWDISAQPGGGGAAEVLAACSDGLQRSTDGGHTWAAEALPGAPGAWNRLAVSIAPSDPTVAYAWGASGGTAYLWQRSGGAWTAVAPPAGVNINQAWYDWYVAASPDNAAQVYLGAIDVYRGDLSGGAWTWTDISSKPAGDSIHPDQHAIAFDPVDPGTVYCGSDGGLFRSPNRGTNWLALNLGLGITEVEYTAQDITQPLWLLAGTQDNGSIRYLGTSIFEHCADGDGGDCGVNQSNPSTCFHSYYAMGMERSTAKGAWGTFAWVGPNVGQNYNALFYPPMGVDSSTVSQAGQSVWISRDDGSNWTEVALPAGQVASALSVPDSDHVYAATTNGRVFRIDWSGAVWTAATELTSPRAAYASAILVDPANANRIWLTYSQVGGSRVHRSDNGGTTWTDCTAGLPNLPINSVVVDNTDATRVWVSADVGVYQSTDTGATWASFFAGLPNVLVEDLKFHPTARVLRAATRNRGVWEVLVDGSGASAPPERATAASVVHNADGRVEAFVAGTDFALWHIWQTAPNNGWSGYDSLGGVLSSSMDSATNADGRVEVFVRGTDGAVWHIWQTAPNNGWSGWDSLGGVITSIAAACRNADGRVEAFARGTDDALWHNWQTAPNNGWSGWDSLGGVITSDPACVQNADGRVEVFARGTDDALWHIWQTAPNNGWSGWVSLGGTVVIEP